ncbi:S1 family peptidase [Lysobacter sp. A289]
MQALWQRAHPSIISLTFLNTAGERITSGSGFKMGRYLITNNHVIQAPSARRVILRTVGPDGSAPVFEADFGRLNFQHMLRSGQDASSWDYAVMAVDHPAFAQIPDLEAKEDEGVTIGSEACFLGFQFEQPNLALHRGLVSSTFVKAGVRYIQIDGSVNHGNSGGPLIDIVDGKVLGIVTRKATGLTKDFEDLDAVLQSNIELLNRSAGGVFLSGIDPIAATRMVQEQIRVIARNIGRSANVGIGYAYHISEVRSALQLL